MHSCLTLKIDCLSRAVLDIEAPCNNNAKLTSNQTCARIRFWSDEKMFYIGIRLMR